MIKTAKIVAIIFLTAVIFTGCGSPKIETLNEFPAADMSGYYGLEEYDKELQFREVSTMDALNMVDEKKTFVLFASFSDCPWCNSAISHLNDIALEEGVRVAYLNTRKNPDWTSNTDIDDYDKFSEYFEEYLPPDEDEIPHLYVPDVFFIKNGKVVYEYQGAVPSQESPSDPVTDEDIEELENIYREGFSLIKK